MSTHSYLSLQIYILFLQLVEPLSHLILLWTVLDLEFRYLLDFIDLFDKFIEVVGLF